MDAYYFPHHQALELAVERALNMHNRALVIDAHSFPCDPLPYEADQTSYRPEICIGTDDFHTPPALLFPVENAFITEGFTVAINKPFSGALVPQRYYRIDPRVTSIMIEVRRDVYIDELTGERRGGFANVINRIEPALREGIARQDEAS